MKAREKSDCQLKLSVRENGVPMIQKETGEECSHSWSARMLDKKLLLVALEPPHVNCAASPHELCSTIAMPPERFVAGCATDAIVFSGPSRIPQRYYLR